jgi:hypothetical protein
MKSRFPLEQEGVHLIITCDPETEEVLSVEELGDEICLLPAPEGQ